MAKRVLIVEDVDDVAQTLVRLCCEWGFECRLAKDGLQALEAVQEFNPDLMILDIGLPKLSGFDVAKQVRKHRPKPTLPIVVVTGRDTADDKDRAMKAGADHYITKPIDSANLEAVVRAILKGQSQG